MSNRSCPQCQKLGHDRDGDHLFLMEDGVTWCCLKYDYHGNGKSYYERDGVESEGGEEDEDVEETLSSISGSVEITTNIFEMLEDIPSRKRKGTKVAKTVPRAARVDKDVESDYRGIPPATFKKYQVYGSYEGKDLKRLSHPIYEVGGTDLCTKYRELPKDFKTHGTSTKGRKVELFGQRHALTSKTLVITEGEIDAMSLDTILGTTKYAKPVICSLPFGANLKSLNDNHKFISSFSKLIICPDNDAAGQVFAKDCASLYPDALFMDLGKYKDVNEMLTEGKEQEVISSYFDAGRYRPPSLVNIKDLKHSLSEAIPLGYSTPWPTLDNLIYGISKGSIISVAAAPAAGKTVFVRAIHKELMDKHGIRVGIYSLEESPETVLRNLVAYEMGVAIGVPGVTYDAKEADRVATSLEKNCLIYDSSHYNGDWKAMIASMRQFCSLGMEVAIVDPVSSLVIGKSSSEGNELLGVIMGDMIKITQETGLSVILVNHLNNAKGKPHENGGRVLASEMTGSRSQYRYSSLILGLERDLLNDDDDIRDTLKVRILKSRLDGSKSGKVCQLKYDQTLKRLVESPSTF